MSNEPSLPGAVLRLSISAGVVFYIGLLYGRSQALQMIAEAGCGVLIGGK